MSPEIVSVSQLVEIIQELVEDNFVDVLVQGELANFSRPTSGHCYFTLKDNKSQLRCVQFRSSARLLRFRPEDGMEVVCRGRLSVYRQRGDLQLIVESIDPVGIGGLQLALAQLQEHLRQEGLFSAEHKRSLPVFPTTVGVVTSETGAAIRDILQVLRRRSTGLRVLLRPVPVQGEGAAAEIARAIGELNEEGSADVLIVGRGGGSLEDLWPFNEEIVARSIFASSIPVVSAVGHEVDTTTADLVADLRAPTPSAAAELVTRNRLELEQHLDHLNRRLSLRMRMLLQLQQAQLRALTARLQSPAENLRLQRQSLLGLKQRLWSSIGRQLELQQGIVCGLADRLHSLSPLAVLQRGYAIAQVEKSKQLLVDSRQVDLGDQVRLQLAHGELRVTVNEQITDTKK